MDNCILIQCLHGLSSLLPTSRSLETVSGTSGGGGISRKPSIPDQSTRSTSAPPQRHWNFFHEILQYLGFKPPSWGTAIRSKISYFCDHLAKWQRRDDDRKTFWFGKKLNNVGSTSQNAVAHRGRHVSNWLPREWEGKINQLHTG